MALFICHWGAHFLSTICYIFILPKTRDGSVIFNNPVGDFIDYSKIAPENLFRKEIIKVDIPEGEKGFLDFMAEIEEDTEGMTTDIQNMSSDMEIMSSGVSEGSVNSFSHFGLQALG